MNLHSMIMFMKHKHPLTTQISDYPLDRILVKKAMLDSDLRIIDLARRFQLTHTTVSLTVSGKTRNLAIQKAIADALKRPLDELLNKSPRLRRKKPKSVSRPSSVSSPSQGDKSSLAASAE